MKSNAKVKELNLKMKLINLDTFSIFGTMCSAVTSRAVHARALLGTVTKPSKSVAAEKS